MTLNKAAPRCSWRFRRFVTAYGKYSWEPVAELPKGHRFYSSPAKTVPVEADNDNTVPHTRTMDEVAPWCFVNASTVSELRLRKPAGCRSYSFTTQDAAALHGVAANDNQKPDYWSRIGDDSGTAANDNHLDSVKDTQLPTRRVSGRTATRFQRSADGTFLLVPIPDEPEQPRKRPIGKDEPWEVKDRREAGRARAETSVAETDFVLASWRKYFGWRQSVGDPSCKNFAPPVRYSKKPVHRELAPVLRPLLAWRALSRTTTELGTNWRLVPRNGEYGADPEQAVGEDGKPQVQGRDRLLETRPTPDELMEYWGDGTDVERSGIGKRRRWMPAGTVVPGPVVRVAGLRFSNGMSEEGGVRARLGALTRYAAGIDRRGIPVVDEFGEERGPDYDDDRGKKKRDELEASNQFWAKLMGTELPDYKPQGQKRRKHMMTPAEQAETLATKSWPTIKYCPPGLPCGSRRVADAFLGQTHNPTYHAASVANDNHCLERTFASAVRASVSEEDCRVLDAALTAGSFQEVGEVLDLQGKTAERRGKTALIDACERLGRNLEKHYARQSLFA